MSTYTVLDNNRDEIGSFKSVTKTLKAIEQYFQSGTAESLKEVRESLKLVGSCVVNHNTFSSINCIIEKS